MKEDVMSPENIAKIEAFISDIEGGVERRQIAKRLRVHVQSIHTGVGLLRALGVKIEKKKVAPPTAAELAEFRAWKARQPAPPALMAAE